MVPVTTNQISSTKKKISSEWGIDFTPGKENVAIARNSNPQHIGNIINVWQHAGKSITFWHSINVYNQFLICIYGDTSNLCFWIFLGRKPWNQKPRRPAVTWHPLRSILLDGLIEVQRLGSSLMERRFRRSMRDTAAGHFPMAFSKHQIRLVLQNISKYHVNICKHLSKPLLSNSQRITGFWGKFPTETIGMKSFVASPWWCVPHLSRLNH